jgi:hypothetical protein
VLFALLIEEGTALVVGCDFEARSEPRSETGPTAGAEVLTEVVAEAVAAPPASAAPLAVSVGRKLGREVLGGGRAVGERVEDSPGAAAQAEVG